MPTSRYEEAILREMDGCVQALLSIKSIDPDVVRLQARRAGLETALKRYREINKLTDEDDQ